MSIPILREFQLDLIERVRSARMRGARIIVVQAATGSGKTTVACAIAKAAVAKGSRVLFMVHRRKLVDQIYSRLEEFEINAGIVMRGEKLYSQASVQVASRDTLLSRCVRNEWIDLPPADLVFVDESHHAADPESEYRRILGNYPKATILLLTATPVGQDGRGMGPWAQAIECAAPTSQLVTADFLVPVKCYAPDRKLHRGKAIRGIAGDLVESWKQYAEGLPTVLFCSRVQHSLDAARAFKDAGIEAVHVDADTDDYSRDAAFEGVANGRIKVISQVGIVGEGVDIPELGCVQMYCECNGRVKWLQACGRIMRPSAGKSYGIVIDHSAAVFKHGFPDEDTPWTLEGNADADFKKKHDDGLTEKVNYCKTCEMLFSGPTCQQCGKMPVKPPRSIFLPPPVEHTNEILTEAERGGERTAANNDEKIKHWMRCLAVAANRNGTFAMASVLYKKKYGSYPDHHFPCVPSYSDRIEKVSNKFPKFLRKRTIEAVE